MQGIFVKEIRETPVQSVKEVGDMLKRVVSHIDKRFMKSRWAMWQEGWEEAIDEAMCADTIFDAGIKIEKSGIDWGRLQILREETQGAVPGSQDKVSGSEMACVMCPEHCCLDSLQHSLARRGSVKCRAQDHCRGTRSRRSRATAMECQVTTAARARIWNSERRLGVRRRLKAAPAHAIHPQMPWTRMLTKVTYLVAPPPPSSFSSVSEGKRLRACVRSHVSVTSIVPTVVSLLQARLQQSSFSRVCKQRDCRRKTARPQCSRAGCRMAVARTREWRSESRTRRPREL